MFDRNTIDKLATHDDIAAMGFSNSALSDEAIALLGFQRTKTISPRSRKAWMAGDRDPLLAEARSRRDEIFESAIHEAYCEYVPVQRYLNKVGFEPRSVIDIGCGQAVPDLFLQRDFKPRFTLVDIEETTEQYHAWADSGSGYASLVDAKAMLHDNGSAQNNVKTINPKQKPEMLTDASADMLISFYSCGFHYPVDEYSDLITRVIKGGGLVFLDLRKRYFNRRPEPLDKVLSLGEMTVVFDDKRSNRVVIAG
ncbi:hypothetical protein AAFO92_15930 [Roseovarius sp. CAU 1744]|uniref:hypothetical protein n=1 Tax=Roseovarius sp. CAU 1744 TaxID=3140368 RepID=UPI00325B708E